MGERFVRADLEFEWASPDAEGRFDAWQVAVEEELKVHVPIGGVHLGASGTAPLHDFNFRGVAPSLLEQLKDLRKPRQKIHVAHFRHSSSG
jgi:hypothetical protein